jgi:DeoR/GlpR family transcriptional regulator of sugar metabolism
MEAIARIRQFKCDLCIMGINAIDPVNGISDNDWEVVQVKKAMIESTKNLVCLTISEKINTQQPISVCGLDRIDTLITELSPDDAVLKPYIDSGITVF